MPTISLREILKYRNEPLIRAFAKKKQLTLAESEDIFLELLKWLWFLANRDTKNSLLPEGFPTFKEQGPIDAFWHEFILDTRAYQEFCDQYFGIFLHHVPTPDGMEGASHSMAQLDPVKMQAITKSLIIRAMHEVHDAFGKETMLLWYVELPRRFPHLVGL